MQWSDERFQAMLKGRRAVKVVAMPGFESDDPDATDSPKVGIRILTDDELDDARRQATDFVLRRAKQMGIEADLLLRIDTDMRDSEFERCMIAKAFVLPDADADGKHKAFFAQGSASLRSMDASLRRKFLGAYLEHQQFVNPQIVQTEAELEQLIDDLGKGLGAEATLLQLDAPSLLRCVLILASRQSS